MNIHESARPFFLNLNIPSYVLIFVSGWSAQLGRTGILGREILCSNPGSYFLIQVIYFFLPDEYQNQCSPKWLAWNFPLALID